MSAIAALFVDGLAAGAIRAVIGKTEGNGGLNDFTRGYFIQSLMLVIAARTGEAAEDLAARIPCVLSGGTEGVLSPHALLLSVEAEVDESPGHGLAIATAFGPQLPAGGSGSDAHIAAVAATVRQAVVSGGFRCPGLVFVKTPAGSLGGMARARAAAALGAAVGWAPGLVLGVRPMADVLDIGAAQALVAALGGPGRLRAVFAKGEPDATGRIRGQRHTMLGHTDIDGQRHLRATLRAIVAAAAGDGRVFVSGGAEHQGPPGGGLIAAIAEMEAS